MPKNDKGEVDIIMNFNSLQEKFRITESSKTKTSLKIKMVPKSEASQDVTSVSITLDLNKNYVQNVDIEFIGGNKSFFVFGNPKPTTSNPKNLQIPKSTKITKIMSTP